MLTPKPNFSTASGIRCRKAPPKSAPAEKLTMKRRTFLSLFILNASVRTPISEIRLTIITLANE